MHGQALPIGARICFLINLAFVRETSFLCSDCESSKNQQKRNRQNRQGELETDWPVSFLFLLVGLSKMRFRNRRRFPWVRAQDVNHSFYEISRAVSFGPGGSKLPGTHCPLLCKPHVALFLATESSEVIGRTLTMTRDGDMCGSEKRGGV